MTASHTRPNTRADDSLLHTDAILCCGEDANELLAAIDATTDMRPVKFQEYRCYRFWDFSAFTLIWSGIGTGCLEPLLFEVLGNSPIERIILIGTAGAISSDDVVLGNAYLINKAYLGAAGISVVDRLHPRVPRFSADRIAASKLQSRSTVSTDYYYGFSTDPDSRAVKLREADPVLADTLLKMWASTELVDMETAQFYHLCSLLGDKQLQFVAIKGPANKVADPSLAATAVLEKAVAHAFRMLGIDGKTAAVASLLQWRPAQPGAIREAKSEDGSTKLVEEVKLYWTIQVAVAGILGYLGTNLNFTTETAVKNIFLCGVSSLLITMGAIYNLIGNYYARIEGSRTGREKDQENIITPTLALIYMIVSGILGGITAYSALRVTGATGNLLSDAFKGGFAGVLLNWLICRRVFRELYEEGLASYRDYSRHLRRLFIFDVSLGGFRLR